MPTIAVYAGAALAEIAGCFAFWAWLRMDKSIWWLVPGPRPGKEKQRSRMGTGFHKLRK